MTKIEVIELFAGVGGFRLGLEGWNGKSASSGYTEKLKTPYKIVWSNQWEPSTKTQHASLVYESKWGKENHSNEDIASVEKEQIPTHNMLVGGFPCQDYSVATSLKNSKGLIGKKGVLWWSIYKIISEKKKKPEYLFLENVDRLLISPSQQRGRDFAIILQSLNELGYAVEWRVINAAEYGMPQRRRRVFILAYHKSTDIFKEIKKSINTEWILKGGVLANAFPITVHTKNIIKEFKLEGDLVELTKNFNKSKDTGMFENAGFMLSGNVTTLKSTPTYEGYNKTLGDIIQKSKVNPEFYIDEKELEKWNYFKGAKKETRKSADGFEYNYSEGGMIFPDPLNKPSRTIITGEGGASPSRFKHVIKTKYGYRRLTPIELERLNMFPDKHTDLAGISDSKRAFFMGNALVVGVIEKIGIELSNRIND
jgi:DNA (cytosine-5)-methyltransferase 1